MANEEHLAFLRRDVEAWNAWREKYPSVRPDLSRADLRKADLYGANLEGAGLFLAQVDLVLLEYAEHLPS